MVPVYAEAELVFLNPDGVCSLVTTSYYSTRFHTSDRIYSDLRIAILLIASAAITDVKSYFLLHAIDGCGRIVHHVSGRHVRLNDLECVRLS